LTHDISQGMALVAGNKVVDAAYSGGKAADNKMTVEEDGGNPPPSAKSQEQVPLADEARQYFTNGEPELADKYFPWLVDLMSPAYWIYLAMAITILFNALNAYSRFRLWRLDANREMLESRLKALTGLKTSQDRKAAEDLKKDLEALRVLCEEKTRSRVTPMGNEMFYRYQELMIKDAQARAALLQRSNGSREL
jgi:hypothetical protein